MPKKKITPPAEKKPVEPEPEVEVQAAAPEPQEPPIQKGLPKDPRDGIKAYGMAEHPVEGKPLGRHIEHDTRSKEHPVRSMVPPGAVQENRLWKPRGSVLSQGSLGSCTGNASVACIMAEPNFTKDRVLTETEAVAIYSRGTVLDGFEGDYPPADTGSSGLAVCKAMVEMGYIEAYKWAFGWEEAQVTLSTLGPLMAGIAWYEGFDSPDATGLVHLTGEVRGGHEVALLGIDYDKRQLRVQQSWGEEWGDKGFFMFTFEDFQRLLNEHGDLAFPVPKTG